MNLYEHTIVARQDTSPAQVKQLTEKYSKIVEKNKGEIVQTEDWGLLNLAYIIKKNKKGKQSNFAKLSIFQPNKYKFKKSCPLSVKGAPEVNYKNIRLLKKYMSENGKILPSRITNVSQKKQRELSLSIKRARSLALL